jgi:DNA-binding response OmpR family regulator
MTRSPQTPISQAQVPPPTPHPAADVPTRILLVDDDRKFTRLMSEYLEPFGYAATAVHTGTEGAERATEPPSAHTPPFAAVILDLMLPGIDGFAVLKRIREKSPVPVLMLTSRGDETDRVVGLEIGADDYVPKTASPREILARLRALLRRASIHDAGPAAPAPAPRELLVGPLRVIPESRRAFVRDQLLTLTPVEFDLLVCLAKARGRVKTRDQLLDEIRDRNFEVFDRSIDVHISALRRKIGDDPRNPALIRTIRTVGYMLDDPDNNSPATP